MAKPAVCPARASPRPASWRCVSPPAWLSWLPVVWGDYQVLALDPDYRIALVGAPGRDYLWLLSRQPTLSEADIALWLDKARALGFPTERVVRTPQLPAVDVTTSGASQ